MDDPAPRDALDENLRRLLKPTAGSRPDFAGRLSDAVLAEVRATGRKRRQQRWLWGAGAAAAVAAACVAVVALRPVPPRTVATWPCTPAERQHGGRRPRDAAVWTGLGRQPG